MSTRALPPRTYRLVWNTLRPVLLAHALLLGIRNADQRYLRQRLGYGYAAPTAARPIWLHAASVGELITALPLIAALRERGLPMVLSTSTRTSAALAAQRLPDITHHYLPWDGSATTRRFLDALRPRCALIIETELWPYLYAACAQRGIPLCIVNARLSERTLHAPRFVRDAYAQSLSQAQVLARSARDQEAFLELGAQRPQLECCGNLKFAQPAAKAGSANPAGRRYWLAASTHASEEIGLLHCWRRAALQEDTLLVIVPRHPDRGPAIARALRALQCRLALRSAADPVTAETEIYVADTLGELADFIAHAEGVFMGGSLAPKGGQNILEPARLGKAILVGPHMNNFADETAALQQAGGLVQVQDFEELGEQFRRLAADDRARRDMGTKAQEFMHSRSDVLPRYLERILGLCC